MYYLEVTANTCVCAVVINGLCIEKLDATHTGSVQYPCNTELVGKENKVEVLVAPTALDPVTLDKIEVHCLVKNYDDNGFVGPEFGEVIAAFSLAEKLEVIRENPLMNIADAVPISLSATFDSEDAPSFEDRLLNAVSINDEGVLKDWAIKFLALLERRDIESLHSLYEPKLADYDIAYPMQKEPDNKVWFANWMNEKIFPQQPITGLCRDDIQCIKWCDGRIWELLAKDGSPLWRTQGFDGRRTSIQVYVGMDDGKIKIVR